MVTKLFSDSTIQRYDNDTKREYVLRVKGGYGTMGKYTKEDIDIINAALEAKQTTIEEVDRNSSNLYIERVYKNVSPSTNVNWFASHFCALRDAGKF